MEFQRTKNEKKKLTLGLCYIGNPHKCRLNKLHGLEFQLSIGVASSQVKPKQDSTQAQFET